MGESFKWAMPLVILMLLWTCTVLAIDLSHSQKSGHYPWEQQAIFEEIGAIKFPARVFYDDLSHLLLGPFSDQTASFSMELRPILVASLVAYVLDHDRPFGWHVEAGDPNPVLVPIFKMLLNSVIASDEEAAKTANILSSYPLMMPDSSGSAVIELRNEDYEAAALAHGPAYALMLPVKMGFWVEGDYVHIDLLGPKALSWLFVGEYDDDIEKYASTVKNAVFAVLNALFDKDELTTYLKPLAPYIEKQPQHAPLFFTFLGTIKYAIDLEPERLLRYLLKTENPTHPHKMPFFQTYNAFDGIAGFLQSAYKNPTNRAYWLPTPNGEVLDDLVFLNLMTATASRLDNEDEITFYKSLLTPMFPRNLYCSQGL